MSRTLISISVQHSQLHCWSHSKLMKLGYNATKVFLQNLEISTSFADLSTTIPTKITMAIKICQLLDYLSNSVLWCAMESFWSVMNEGIQREVVSCLPVSLNFTFRTKITLLYWLYHLRVEYIWSRFPWNIKNSISFPFYSNLWILILHSNIHCCISKYCLNSSQRNFIHYSNVHRCGDLKCCLNVTLSVTLGYAVRR